MRLYEISDEIERIIARLDDGDASEVLADLDALQLERVKKHEGIIFAIMNRQAMGEACARERDRFAARARSCKDAVDWLKQYLMSDLERMGQSKVDVCEGIHGARIQANSRPSFACADPAALPAELLKPPRAPELDDGAVMAAWKCGMLPEGIEVKSGRHLRVH